MTTSTAARRPVGLRSAPRGFTIGELLIVVALVGILAAVAIPSYSAYLVRGQRAAAKAALLQAADFMERAFTSNGCYNFDSPQGCQSGAGTATALLSGFSRAPTDGSTQTYLVQLTFPTTTTYLLTATPCGDSGTSCPAGSNQGFTDPDCDVLTVTNTGARTASGTIGSSSPALCWSR